MARPPGCPDVWALRLQTSKCVLRRPAIAILRRPRRTKLDSSAMLGGKTPVVTEAAIRRRALERAAEAAETLAAKATNEEAREVAILRAAELAREAESVVVPAPYRLLADDATPEILATLLAQQGGRIALLSPEGGVVGQMAGRYSGARVPGANLGVYLKGHAGDRLRIDRVGRPSEYVARPALTIGLAVQPEVLRTMAEIPELGGLGVLARFLYSLPASRMGARLEDPEPV